MAPPTHAVDVGAFVLLLATDTLARGSTDPADRGAGSRAGAGIAGRRPMAAPAAEPGKPPTTPPCAASVPVQCWASTSGTGEAELPGEEPFQLGRQDGFRLAERLLPLCLAGAGDAGIEEIALAGSELPHGAAGRTELGRQQRGLVRFCADLTRPGPTHTLASVPFALAIGEASLTGSLSGLHAGGLFGHRLGTLGAFTLWNAWLRQLVLCYLVLCYVSPTGVAARSRWLLKDVLLEFTPVEDAQAKLGTLLGQYRRGLSTPLAYAPRSALALIAGSARPRTARPLFTDVRETPAGETIQDP